jgi:hypothetical protein
MVSGHGVPAMKSFKMQNPKLFCHNQSNFSSFFFLFIYLFGVSRKQFKAKPQTCCYPFPQANFA